MNDYDQYIDLCKTNNIHPYPSDSVMWREHSSELKNGSLAWSTFIPPLSAIENRNVELTHSPGVTGTTSDYVDPLEEAKKILDDTPFTPSKPLELSIVPYRLFIIKESVLDLERISAITEIQNGCYFKVLIDANWFQFSYSPSNREMYKDREKLIEAWRQFYA
jgi:hypothetical protein